jgi:hypothetical protein
VRTLLLALALALAPGLAGCSASGCGRTVQVPTAPPIDVKVEHNMDPSKACDDHVVVKAGTPQLHVVLTLENYYKSHCPGPPATVTLVAPDGATHAQLTSQQLPTFDCVYNFDRNETLAPGTWTLKYSGGSVSPGGAEVYLASLLEITNASAIA